ncbi:MAG: ribosome maturation factor RimM [Oscillospiraceae bacterium]|nr:ribosome maturation factor RimM [Oscillospiraceae bacterium]
MKQPFLQAGKVVSTHGLLGEVKILPWADGPDFLLQFDTLYLDGAPYQVARSRVQGTCVLCKFTGIDAVEAAAPLRGKIVTIDRSTLQLPDGVCFIADLIGLTAQTGDGAVLGHVAEVLPMPAGDVLVIRGEQEYMIPNVDAFVHTIDVDAGFMTVSVIEGMQTDASH